MTKTVNDTSNTVTVRYVPLGASRELFTCRAGEICLDGPAGTGKTRSILEKLHLCMLKYPGSKALMTRKTNTALAATAMQTFQHKVLHPLDGVRWFGGSRKDPPGFNYPNGSRIVVCGLDKPEKVMSSEYDIIYINEATECKLEDIEALTTRLRNGVIPYQQLLMDCNPSFPEHWLNKRMQTEQTLRFLSRHEDNPVLYDAKAGEWTEPGRVYIDRLDKLTGVRYQRLRLGKWAAAENTIYQDCWDANINLIDSFPIPREWPRFIGIDFGFTHPFCCQWWAQDPDGRLYLYREIYMTKKLVEDHAKDIIRHSGWRNKDGDPLPYAIYRDHDAEDGATLDRHLKVAGFSIRTTPAVKAVTKGIQAVSERMRPAGDGKPRLFIMRGALVEIDRELQGSGLPYSTLHEIDMYEWNDAKDMPVKAYDHGMDTMRYIVASLDTRNNKVTFAQNIWED